MFYSFKKLIHNGKVLLPHAGPSFVGCPDLFSRFRPFSEPPNPTAHKSVVRQAGLLVGPQEAAGPRSHTDYRPQTGLLELTFRNLVEDGAGSQVL